MSANVSAKQHRLPSTSAWRETSIAPKATRNVTYYFSLGVRALGISLLLSMLPRLIVFLQMSTSLIWWRWQIDYDEGINLNATLQLAKWHNIYHHNGPEGFISAPYSPLYYVINAPITWITGPQFAPGRIISLLSTLLIAFLLVRIAHKTTGVWAAGFAGGALWLCASPVIIWAAFYKQDMMALALGLVGFSCALSYASGTPSGQHKVKAAMTTKSGPEALPQHKHNYSSIYIAAIFFALSFWTKQSSISAAVAVALWLVLRQPRAGLRLISLMLAMVVVPFLSINALLHGALWEHMVAYHAMPPEPGRSDWMLKPLWAEYTPLLLWAGLTICGALVAIIYCATLGRKSGTRRSASREALLDGPWVPVTFYALVGGASTLVQSGYEGANFNHLLDAILPACLLAGLSAGWLWKQVERSTALIGSLASKSRKRIYWKAGRERGALWIRTSLIGSLIGATFVCIIFAEQIVSFKDPQGWFYNSWPNSVTDLQMRRLSDLVAHTAGPIYSEDAYLLLSTGHKVMYDDASTFMPLAKLGRWDESGLVGAFRKRTFRMVILTHGSPRFTQRTWEALSADYHMEPYGPMDVYLAGHP